VERVLSFSVPTREAERLFLESFATAKDRFRQSLVAVSQARLSLANTDLDTGRPTRRGEYSLADETYDEWLGKLADGGFANVSASLQSDLVDYYGDLASLPTATGADRKRTAAIRQHLARLSWR